VVQLTTGAGDGGLRVDVDLFGAFGTAVGLDSGDAFYDPVGPVDESGTTFESAVAFRTGSSGDRVFLTEGSIGASSPNVPATLIAATDTSVESSFRLDNLDFNLTQTVESTLLAGERIGSLLEQTYTVTNATDETVTFEFVRLYDSDLLFDGSTDDAGGGLIRGLQPGDEVFFETDGVNNDATATTFVGISDEGGTPPTAGRLEGDSFPGLRDRLIDGIDPDDTLAGDTDGDDLVDTDVTFLTFALRRLFELAPGESATYTALTNFGSGELENIFPGLTDPDSLVGATIASGEREGGFQLQSPLDGTSQIEFQLEESPDTEQINELGIFLTDDVQGSIGALSPGSPGYLEAALSPTRSQVLFSALPEGGFAPGLMTRQLALPTGQNFGFFLVRDNTLEGIIRDRDRGAITSLTPENVLLSFPASNPGGADALRETFSADGSEFRLLWNNNLEGSSFDDLLVTGRTVTDLPPLGTAQQGGSEGELLDFSAQEEGTTVTATLQIASEAAFDNTIGFYAIANTGGLVTSADPVTGLPTSLAPGATGYAEAALGQRVVTATPGDSGLTVELEAGQLYAPFIIADGTVGEFLAENPRNRGASISDGAPIAYFAFFGANPDFTDRVRLLGDNTFGFEDLPNLGDADYNDMVVRVEFA